MSLVHLHHEDNNMLYAVCKVYGCLPYTVNKRHVDRRSLLTLPGPNTNVFPEEITLFGCCL